MSDEDFDLNSLADFLHLEVGKVSRMAERGKLPGRRVGGIWRFSRPEIHHWLESHIGRIDEDELQQVEDALERVPAPLEDALLSVTDLLPIEAVQVPLEARTRNSVITSMAEVAARTGWLWDPAAMADAVRNREDLYPTALETGVAMLHPRRPMSSILGRAFIAFGRTKHGIPFGSSRGSLTDLFFLLCSVNDRGHLHALARLSRLLASDDFVAELRAAPDGQAVVNLAAAREKLLLG
jgi:PTS system nitrogen regulatory IIA component